MILKYTHEKPLPVPDVAPVVAIPEFTLGNSVPLWRYGANSLVMEQPKTMEELDQSYGYIDYRTKLQKPLHDVVLKLTVMQDFAAVYLDNVRVGTLDRHYHQDTLTLTSDKPAQLDILVENTGRLNSTKWMRLERKGMTGASLDGTPLAHWEIVQYRMEIAPPDPKDFAAKDLWRTASGPRYEFGSFDLAKTGDAFLDVTSLGKGLIWINGHALGRFWNIGPQDTLYVPAPWLKQGRNEVAVFELLPTGKPETVVGRMKAILDGPTPGYESDPERKKKTAADAEFGTKLATPADGSPKPKE